MGALNESGSGSAKAAAAAAMCRESRAELRIALPPPSHERQHSSREHIHFASESLPPAARVGSCLFVSVFFCFLFFFSFPPVPHFPPVCRTGVAPPSLWRVAAAPVQRGRERGGVERRERSQSALSSSQQQQAEDSGVKALLCSAPCGSLASPQWRRARMPYLTRFLIHSVKFHCRDSAAANRAVLVALHPASINAAPSTRSLPSRSVIDLRAAGQ